MASNTLLLDGENLSESGGCGGAILSSRSDASVGDGLEGAVERWLETGEQIVPVSRPKEG